MTNDDCSICLEILDAGVNNINTTKLSCGHEFHVNCIISCLRKCNECPYCRDTENNRKISIHSAYDADTFDDDDDGYTEESDNNDEWERNYNDCVKTLQQIRRKNPEIKTIMRDFLTTKKILRRKTNDLYLKFAEERRKADQIFLENAVHSDYYKEYMNVIQTYERDHRTLYKMYRRTFLKENPMEMGPDIKEYLNYYIDEAGIGEPQKFEMPRVHRKYFYMF
jgi:hypothetical protein